MCRSTPRCKAPRLCTNRHGQIRPSFFVTHDRGSDHPDVIATKPLRGRNQWPQGFPGLRADMMAFFAALNAMCDRMLPAFAVALGLPPDYFAPYFANEAHANLRFLHYPPRGTVDDNSFGQAPHTDNSFMTARARTEVPGLAVRLPSGEWFAPPIIPGTFLINLGNIMRRFSNDRFLSTPHGVINESGTDRYSIAYFYSPDPDAVIECVPTCTGVDNPPRYPPAIYRDLVLEFYRAKLFSPKGSPLRRCSARRRGGGVAHKLNQRPAHVRSRSIYSRLQYRRSCRSQPQIGPRGRSSRSIRPDGCYCRGRRGAGLRCRSSTIRQS